MQSHCPGKQQIHILDAWYVTKDRAHTTCICLVIVVLVDMYQLTFLLMALSNILYIWPRRMLAKIILRLSFSPIRSCKWAIKSWHSHRFWVSPGCIQPLWRNSLMGFFWRHNGKTTFVCAKTTFTNFVTNWFPTCKSKKNIMRSPNGYWGGTTGCCHSVPTCQMKDGSGSLPRERVVLAVMAVMGLNRNGVVVEYLNLLWWKKRQLSYLFCPSLTIKLGIAKL